MATNLALAFLALCLGSCLAPADGHACCHRETPVISAETGGCWLEADGVSVSPIALPADRVEAGTVRATLTAELARHRDAPLITASPPLILRV